MNKFIAYGNLGKDNDLKYTSTGTAVLGNSLGIKDDFQTQGEYKTTWVNIVLWRKQAENFANFTRKGSKVGIEGRLSTRTYEGNDGQTKYVTEIVVDKFHLLETREVTEKRPQGSTQPQGAQQQQQPQQNNFQQQNYNQQPQQNNYQQQNRPFMEDGRPIDITEDDLPF